MLGLSERVLFNGKGVTTLMDFHIYIERTVLSCAFMQSDFDGLF